MKKPRLMQSKNDDDDAYHNHERPAADDRSQCPGPKAKQDETHRYSRHKKAAFENHPQPAPGEAFPFGADAGEKQREVHGKQRDSSPAASTLPR